MTERLTDSALRCAVNSMECYGFLPEPYQLRAVIENNKFVTAKLNGLYVDRDNTAQCNFDDEKLLLQVLANQFGVPLASLDVYTIKGVLRRAPYLYMIIEKAEASGWRIAGEVKERMAHQLERAIQRLEATKPLDEIPGDAEHVVKSIFDVMDTAMLSGQLKDTRIVGLDYPHGAAVLGIQLQSGAKYMISVTRIR